MPNIIEADRALKDRKYRRAVKLYQVLVQAEPDNPLIYQGLAQGLLRVKAYENAKSASLEALKLSPNLFLPYIVMAYASYATKDLDAFRANAQKAIELNPSSAEALTCYGTMLLVDEDLDGSIKTLNKALQIDPTNVVAYRNLEIAYRQKGDSKNALLQAKKMFSISPTIKAALHLISAYQMAYPYLVGILLVVLIVLAIVLRTIYLLIPQLLYAMYGLWISIRLVLEVEKKRKYGLFLIAYSFVMMAIVYVAYVFIR